MGRPSLRDKILESGLRVVHERGFSGATVRDIVEAAGVPQGSFTNHFGTKEAFGLEILDLYFANSRSVIANSLLNQTLPPLERIARYVDANRDYIMLDGMRNGCLLGNFSAEVVDQSEAMRLRLVEIFDEIRGSLMVCLSDAKEVGEIALNADIDSLARFTIASLQGAILIAKVERSTAPVDNFKALLLSNVLR